MAFRFYVAMAVTFKCRNPCRYIKLLKRNMVFLIFFDSKQQEKCGRVSERAKGFGNEPQFEHVYLLLTLTSNCTLERRLLQNKIAFVYRAILYFTGCL